MFKKLSVLLFISLFVLGGYSQNPPKPVPQSSEILKDAKGNPTVFDYQVGIKPFTHPSLSPATFKGKNLVIYYFSSSCPHCQHAIPFVGAFAEKAKKDSIFVIACAAPSNSKEQIGEFVQTYKVKIPVFHDSDRKLSDLYGTGRVPVTLGIKKDGKMLRFSGFDEATTPKQLQEFFKKK